MAKQNEQYICDRFQGLIPGSPAATTTEIAAELGISYQGVHRILKKHNLGRKDGGKAAQVASRTADVAEVVKTTVMCDKYGCTKEQWDELRAMDDDYKKTPLAAFHTFKNNFHNLYPAIEFQLSMWEWWSAWDVSGMWGKHKRNPDGMFVLAQDNKELPLSKSNIRIIPFAQLLRETRKLTPRKSTLIAVEPVECV